MNSGFFHRKQEHDYFQSLKKMVGLLVEQLQSQLQITTLINQIDFQKYFLHQYTKIQVLENQRKSLQYPIFSDLCASLYSTLLASVVVHSPAVKIQQSMVIDNMEESVYSSVRLNSTQIQNLQTKRKRAQSGQMVKQNPQHLKNKFSFTEKHKSNQETKLETNQDTLASQQPIIVNNDLQFFIKRSQINTSEQCERQHAVIPRQIFQEKNLRKLFVQSNIPPIYICKSPLNLEQQQQLYPMSLKMPDYPLILQIQPK